MSKNIQSWCQYSIVHEVVGHSQGGLRGSEPVGLLCLLLEPRQERVGQLLQVQRRIRRLCGNVQGRNLRIRVILESFEGRFAHRLASPE